MLNDRRFPLLLSLLVCLLGTTPTRAQSVSAGGPLRLPLDRSELTKAGPTSWSGTTQGRDQLTFRTPIKRRLGRTPVIEVVFNGSHRFEMIVDTGANDTVITQEMAAAMGIVPVAKLKFDTASARGIEMPLGRVKSVVVNGVGASNLLVAIAGPELGIGLLGHDFFGNYDLTIRQDVIEFRVR